MGSRFGHLYTENYRGEISEIDFQLLFSTRNSGKYTPSDRVVYYRLQLMISTRLKCVVLE